MNIIQTLLGALTPTIMQKLAGMLGESEAATGKSLGAALPAILGAMIAKGGDAKGAGALIDMMTQHKVSGDALNQMGEVLGGGDATAALQSTGGELLKGLLGDKAGAVTDLLARFGGMKAPAAQSLLALAAPLVMGQVAKAQPAGALTPASLMDLLASQKEHVAKLLPPGLGALIGLPMISGGAAAAAPMPAPTPAAPAAAPAREAGLTPWLIALALLAGVALFGPRMCSTQTATQAPTPAVEAGKITLPGGVTLTVPPGSIGEQLANFLASADATPKTFTFDHLNFESGRATLTADSQQTVDAIATILKAYASAGVRLEGYTDNQGRPAANQLLSEQRAKAVGDLLVTAGIARARVETAGHGADNPVGDNATEEGRAKNRRLELTVVRK